MTAISKLKEGDKGNRTMLSTEQIGSVANRDLLQIGLGDSQGLRVFSLELRSDAKEGMNEPALPDNIAFP